jgi:XRE family aerobic/anaerobic benzoate catabolism transcriptional regulator
VLATGGGIVSARETYDLLKSRFFTIWLKAEPKDHWDRVVHQGDTRPMANDDQAFTNLCSLLEEREGLYGEARLVVDTSANPVDAVVDELSGSLGGFA